MPGTMASLPGRGCMALKLFLVLEKKRVRNKPIVTTES
jgi:hypothetical protein